LLYTYDAAGDITLDPDNSYAYDAEGRLCAVYSDATKGYTQYLYDAEGRRVGKGSMTSLACNAPTSANGFTLTNMYLVNGAAEQVTELNGSGVLQHANLWVGGKLLATYDFAEGDLHLALTDPLGTKRAQVSGTGYHSAVRFLSVNSTQTNPIPPKTANTKSKSRLDLTGCN
jgi:YD repeat-containing protein